MTQSMCAIVRQVAERHGVPVHHVVGVSRSPEHVKPRTEAMYLIRETGRFSYPQIGRFFGRDHSTVIAAVRRHKLGLDAGRLVVEHEG